MRKVILEGSLGEQFGKEHIIGPSVKSFKDALNLIGSNKPEFRKQLRKLAVEDGVDFIVKTGEKESLDEKEILLATSEIQTYTLIPVPAGAGGKFGSFFKIIIGVVLIAVAILNPGLSPFVLNTLFASGAALITAGLTTLLAPDIKEDEDQNGPASYLFRGAAQNSREGDPVPLLYGRLRVGGRPISLEIINGQFKA